MRFTRKPESAAEVQAERKLDEATKAVAWQEFDKEGERERWGLGFGPFRFLFGRGRRVPFRHVPGDPVSEPVDDPDPADERGLRG